MTARVVSLALLVLLAGSTAWLVPRKPPDRFAAAIQLLEQKRAEDASYLFRDPSWRGIAEYRAKRYFRALGAFVQEENARNLYNLGNAYAQLQEWAGAKSAYRKALRLDPGHEDAQHNLAVVIRAEAREQEILDEQRATKRAGRWHDGNRESKPEGGAEPADRTEQGGGSDGEQRAADTKSSEAGPSDRPGKASDKPLTQEARGGASDGRADEEATRVLEGGAGRAAALRESRQEAELLLRRIKDNPVRVLAARLNAVHRQQDAGR
ncbi:MAG: tetratricopeptide repeat protein [Alphaproteobacteria bacterium]|nr:tetratricopeptide repeat protein [Alphaproteobacteria bacterium]